MIFRVAGKPIEIEERRILEDNKNVRKDVSDYLKGKRVSFGYKIDLSGLSQFQREVLEEMRKIPYGKMITYGRLAIRSGYPLADRAVGSVCNKNPLPIIIPCHRVVGKAGLGGYAFGALVKKRLLEIEGHEKP